ncbi:uncharacterized protein LOC121261210 [Juglans microcarpa x Juglans regia]|uniref:uncharacterized protein LOC121261210 n=1 Tax=Juglans microcarpa x Juglans regia TaxID=2249226 RepID=UPI001B7EA278|nr:uncharacterized protein LOC121261210 [Juglans microcarpa x Juglans regia]
MMLRDTIDKTKILFCETLQNLKFFFSDRYQKFPKLPSFDPFSCGCGSCNRGDRQRDQFYIDFCDEWEANLGKAKKSYNTSIVASEEPRKEEDAKQSPAKSKQEVVAKEMKTKESPQIGKGDEACSKKRNGKGNGLAQKMKDLEMMEAGDVEQVLDVEEALHYYSRLTSPVYLDLVDKFFTDVYTEYSVPQASSINTSKRRLGSIRL